MFYTHSFTVNGLLCDFQFTCSGTLNITTADPLIALSILRGPHKKCICEKFLPGVDCQTAAKYSAIVLVQILVNKFLNLCNNRYQIFIQCINTEKVL